jgi:hypothetical protein
MFKNCLAIVMAASLVSGCDDKAPTAGSTGNSAAVAQPGVGNIAEFPGLDRACLVVVDMATVIAIGGNYTVGQIAQQLFKNSEGDAARWEKVQDTYIWRFEKFDPLTKAKVEGAIEFKVDDSPMAQSVRDNGDYCGPLLLRATRGIYDGSELDAQGVSGAILTAAKNLNDAGGLAALNPTSGASSSPVDGRGPIAQAVDLAWSVADQATRASMGNGTLENDDAPATTMPSAYLGVWAQSPSECEGSGRVEMTRGEILIENGAASIESVAERPGGHEIVATRGGGHGATDTFAFRKRDRALELTLTREDGRVEKSTLFPCPASEPR